MVSTVSMHKKFVCRHKCLHVCPRVGNNDRQNVPVLEQGVLYNWYPQFSSSDALLSPLLMGGTEDG
jgi:hypothetical protein